MWRTLKVEGICSDFRRHVKELELAQSDITKEIFSQDPETLSNAVAQIYCPHSGAKAYKGKEVRCKQCGKTIEG